MNRNLFRSLLLVPVLAMPVHAYAQHAPIVVLSSDGSSHEIQVNTRNKFGKDESITAPVFNESNGE